MIDIAGNILELYAKNDIASLEDRGHRSRKLLASMKIDDLKPEFASIYEHTLVKYSIDITPLELVKLFALKEIRFVFERNDRFPGLNDSQVEEEVVGLIRAGKIPTDVKNIFPNAEEFKPGIRAFLNLLREMRRLSANPPEVKLYNDLNWEMKRMLGMLEIENYLKVEKERHSIIAEEEKEEKKELKKIKVQRIKIRHIKCFEEVEIDFAPAENTGLIIGTNGKGKSTILQLIALGLSGIASVPIPYNWKEVVKKNHDRGFFELDILYDNVPIHLKFEIDSKDDSITCTDGNDRLQSLRDTFLLLAYGVNRSIKLAEIRPYKYIEPIATLFGENGYLEHIKISSTYVYVNRHFKIIQALINKVLEKANGIEKVMLTDCDSSTFYFKTPSNPNADIPTEALSEGFKSTLVWLFDAIIRIVKKGGSLENAARVTGIILLDEIDLHLHPTWQRTILRSIETLFPNIQLIVTSHSPFVVQSAKKECLIALEMEVGSDNVIVVDKDITSELSYSAIVREIFNISFPFNHEIEQEMDKFREMVNAIRDNKPIDEKKFEDLAYEIAGKGVELEGIIRRELMTLQRRTGKTFDLWKK